MALAYPGAAAILTENCNRYCDDVGVGYTYTSTATLWAKRRMTEETELAMPNFVQRFFTGAASFLQESIATLFYTLWYAIFQIKLYVNPTTSRRLGVGGFYNGEFAYQKAESRFDIYPIRAIIRDEYILNGQQGRPQRHPF